MNEQRKHQLETIAASLTNAYYSVHRGGSPDHREVIETYRFLLDALVEYDEGESPLRAGDTLASFEGDAPIDD